MLLVLGTATYLIKMSQPKVAVATLNSKNDSGQAGTATIVTTQDAKSIVTITLFGVTAGIAQPAQIRKGTCDKLGDVVHPLNNLLNGDSETIIDASVSSLAQEMPVVVSIYKSERQMSSSASCGSIIIP